MGLILVDSRSKNFKDIYTGLRMVVTVYQNIEPKHKGQAIARLVAPGLNSLKGCYPLALVTDLDKDWQFMWLHVDEHEYNDWKRVIAQFRFTEQWAAERFLREVTEAEDAEFEVWCINGPLMPLNYVSESREGGKLKRSRIFPVRIRMKNDRVLNDHEKSLLDNVVNVTCA